MAGSFSGSIADISTLIVMNTGQQLNDFCQDTHAHTLTHTCSHTNMMVGFIGLWNGTMETLPLREVKPLNGVYFKQDSALCTLAENCLMSYRNLEHMLKYSVHFLFETRSVKCFITH